MAADDIKRARLNLLCLDASEHSSRAVNWYVDNVHRDGDSVGIVHVHTLPELPSFGLYAGGMIATDLYQEQIKESIQNSKKTVAQYKGLLEEKGITPQVFCETMVDSVGHTICDIAKKNNAAFLVIGQRGLGMIRRTFLGSVSDYVIHHSDLPVAVVPPNE